MDVHDYDKLRKIAAGIRQRAVDAKKGDLAVLEFRKLAEFMFHSIYCGGEDIRIGDQQDFVASLRTLAAQLEQSTPRSKEHLRTDLYGLIDQYASTYGNKFSGMAALGEHLLQAADYGDDETVSWAGLLCELKRRSG